MLQYFLGRHLDDRLDRPGIRLPGKAVAHAEVEDIGLHIDIDDRVKPLVLLF